MRIRSAYKPTIMLVLIFIYNFLQFKCHVTGLHAKFLLMKRWKTNPRKIYISFRSTNSKSVVNILRLLMNVNCNPFKRINSLQISSCCLKNTNTLSVPFLPNRTEKFKREKTFIHS